LKEKENSLASGANQLLFVLEKVGSMLFQKYQPVLNSLINPQVGNMGLAGNVQQVQNEKEMFEEAKYTEQEKQILTESFERILAVESVERIEKLSKYLQANSEALKNPLLSFIFN
jgi:hypothetical protein